MVGSELPTPETRESTVTEDVMLSVQGLGVQVGERWVLQDVSFRIRRGEIVGIAGVEGNGQSELIEALIGLRVPSTGTVELNGVDIATWPTRQRHEAGLAYIPEDRHVRGLLLPSPLWENTMLGHQTRAPMVRGPWVDRRGAKGRASQVIERYNVMAPGTGTAALALSGGNQQKLIVGREMVAGPKMLIAAHPSRGIDVGAQAAVWEKIREARAAGLALLLVSADLEELIGLSDTLLVILRGRIVAELDPARVTPEELGSYMTGAREARSA
jgi:simple sugar transport system ATP-binding protein